MGAPTVTAFDMGAEVHLDLATRAALQEMREGILNAVSRYAFERHGVPIRLATSAVAVASTRCVLDIGGPNTGRYWEVAGIAVIGSDDHTVLASTFVALYAGQ